MASDNTLSRVLQLARIALAFGRVERATLHEDAVRAETDTDHTVMLGFVACEIAPEHLDRARIAAFALVHDIAEVYAGDTQTLTITPDAMAAKRGREESARKRLATELGAGSWIADTLATYEQQVVPEARFVRLVDKILPKLTHAFNGCASAKALTDREGFLRSHARQLRDMEVNYPEFADALALLRAAMLYAESCWYDESAQPKSTGEALAATGAQQERDSLRAQLAQVTAERDDVVHGIDWSAQSDIRFACDGVMSDAPWTANPSDKLPQVAGNGRRFSFNGEAVTCVACHQSFARARREEGERAVSEMAARLRGMPAGLPSRAEEMKGLRASAELAEAQLAQVTAERDALRTLLADVESGEAPTCEEHGDGTTLATQLDDEGNPVCDAHSDGIASRRDLPHADVIRTLPRHR